MSVSFDVNANRALDGRSDAELPEEAQGAAAVASPEPGARSAELFWNPQLARIVDAALAANSPVGPAAGNGAGFDAAVRGTEPKAIDETLARLSQDVYDVPATGSSPSSIDGFTRMSDAELEAAGIDPASLDDPSTGFRAAIYENADGQKVLAFAGTREGKDWYADGTQALGLPTAQYSQAVALATQAKAAFGDSMVVTGHSLGGGLASIASVATDSAAVTFNAAGVNDATIRRLVPDADVGKLKQEAADGLIRRYAVDGEVLTGEQESGAGRGFLPDALGHEITLHDPSPLPWYEQLPGVNLVTDTAHGIALHSMDSVLSALGKDHPWAPDGDGKSVLDRIVDGTGDAGDAIVDGIDVVKNGAKSVIDKVSDEAGDLLGHVPLVGGLLEKGAHLVGTLGEGIVEIGGDIANGIVGIGAHLLQGAERFVGGALDAAVDGAKKVGGWIADGAKTVGNAIADGAKTVGHAISSAMPWNW
ncbi:MAG TPA: Mbeg1-like protein [Rhodanobacteraceae bacterium]|nr:Mbeg1-like protein [Rhodanobacteraceae bacterium]